MESPSTEVPHANVPRRLRHSQRGVFETLVGLSHVILNSPTGWGKTTVLIFLAIRRLLTSPASKIVITVPQRIIGEGFVRPMDVELPDGHGFTWGAIILCEKSPAKVARLVRWLALPTEEVDCRVVVTTHASLVAAYVHIADPVRSFGDTTLIIDEGHHVRAGDADAESYNRLGAVANTLIDLDVSVWLATAFFFRGDQLPILDERQLAKFRRVFIPLDEHLAEMAHLKSYAYDFVAYRQSVFPDLESLLRRSQEPTLIYCPPEGHATLQGQPKSPFVGRVADLLRRHYRQCKSWSPDLPRSSRNVLVDLVDQADRELKIRFINRHGDRIAAVLTVGMMQEGADWPACARVIDLMPTTSDQVRNQRFGRLIRDDPGKAHIQYYSFLPYLLDQAEDEQRATFSRLFAHLHASLVLENALKPIKLPSRRRPGSERATREGHPGGGGQPVDFLGQFDEPQQVRIEDEVSRTLVHLAGTTEGPLSWEAAGPEIESVLTRLGCSAVIGEENLPALRDQIVLLWRRRKQPKLAVEDLVRAGFDKVWAPDAIEPIRLFSAGLCGKPTFEELRAIIGGGGQQDAEAWARACAARYQPGQLPSQVGGEPQEREDAMRIAHFRMYKKGKKNGTFFPSVQEIFEAAGHVGIFETTDFQLEAEAWARECAARYKPGRLPSQKSRDPQERYDGLKLANMKRAKNGEGTCTFYPSVEAIFESAGHAGAFDKVDRRRAAEAWAEECSARYEPGRLPSEKSRSLEERRDGKKIAHLRSAKRGKSQGVFYPSVEAIFQSAGHRGAFG
jgi:hypothetical protein